MEVPTQHMRGLHSARPWGEGIVQAWCDRCEKLASARCIKEHGAGLYACMDAAHVVYYSQLHTALGPTKQGAVWCWGSIRQEGIHLWAQYALPEAMINAACRPWAPVVSSTVDHL